jgi:hypothetical protein
MGTPLYMRSVVDGYVVMRLISVLTKLFASTSVVMIH